MIALDCSGHWEVLKNGEIGSLDHLVSRREQLVRHRQSKRFGGFEVDEQLEFGRLLEARLDSLIRSSKSSH